MPCSHQVREATQTMLTWMMHDTSSVPPSALDRTLPALQAMHTDAPLPAYDPLAHCMHTITSRQYLLSRDEPECICTHTYTYTQLTAAQSARQDITTHGCACVCLCGPVSLGQVLASAAIRAHRRSTACIRSTSTLHAYHHQSSV
jgi:hypothetical protein